MKCINKRFVRVCSLLLVCSLCTISGTGCGENRLEDAFEADLPGIGIQTSEESSKIPYFASDLCVTDTDVQDIEADTEDALAACFFNLNEKKVLYAKNIHERMYPASTTKIMTALVALDKGDLDAQTTVSKEAITFSESGVSTAKLKEGDVTVPDGVTAVGGKTGTTTAAMSCLVQLFEDAQGEQYVAIILGCKERGILYQEMQTFLSNLNN